MQGRKSRRLADDFRRARSVFAQILFRECRRLHPPPAEEKSRRLADDFRCAMGMFAQIIIRESEAQSPRRRGGKQQFTILQKGTSINELNP